MNVLMVTSRDWHLGHTAKALAARNGSSPPRVLDHRFFVLAKKISNGW